MGHRGCCEDMEKQIWAKAGTVVSKLSFQATKLIESHYYQFRIFSENTSDLSIPLEGTPIAAKNPYGLQTSWSILVQINSNLEMCLDAPGAPARPWITEVTPSSVALRWDKPRSDGGLKINGFVVEYREVVAAPNAKPGLQLVSDLLTPLRSQVTSGRWIRAQRALVPDMSGECQPFSSLSGPVF